MAGIEGSIHCVLLRSSTPFPKRLRHFQVRAESSACVVAGSRVERGAPSWVFPFEKIAACTMERGQGNSGTLVKRPRILGVAHMALYVGDLAKSRSFYKDFLGFEEPFSL